MHGSFARASPPSTLNSPTSGVWLHTHFNKPEHKSPTTPRLLTSQIQRQRGQRGVILQSVTQRRCSFYADSTVYRHTRVERSKHEFSETVPMGNAVNRQSQQAQQSHSIHGGIDRGSPQSTLNSPTKEHQKHKSPTKPRLLTIQIHRQRGQRGVVLQSVTQCLRFTWADFIVYRHTPSGEHVRRGNNRCDEVGPRRQDPNTQNNENTATML
jgi:hypothetical protein